MKIAYDVAMKTSRNLKNKVTLTKKAKTSSDLNPIPAGLDPDGVGYEYVPPSIIRQWECVRSQPDKLFRHEFNKVISQHKSAKKALRILKVLHKKLPKLKPVIMPY
jgi:hypothetical protein